ncbi:MAG: hypothetical protein UU44_C0005G0063 [Candidatus Daviesbacteria bacterium GW2011_GWB1_41_15]|nr:MAG: hypothetical protein UU44_C0005G0063 [Candidatus Daviesbacteria bacterium GW2011_GWB1_41_15]
MVAELTSQESRPTWEVLTRAAEEVESKTSGGVRVKEAEVEASSWVNLEDPAVMDQRC